MVCMKNRSKIPSAMVSVVLSSVFFSLHCGIGISTPIFVEYYTDLGGIIYGRVEIDVTDYRPTCGWKLTMVSNFPLDFYTLPTDFTYKRLDSHSFLLGNLSNNGDFTSKDFWKFNVEMLGNNSCEINVTWYCVCDKTTHDECQVVNSASSVNNASTVNNASKFGNGSSVNNASNVNTASSVANTSSVDAESLQGNIAQMAYFVKQDNLCYTGYEILAAKQTDRLLDCGAACLLNPACQGINIRQDENICALVLEDPEAASLLGEEDGCAYWKLLK